MELEVPKEVKTLEKEGVLAPRLMLGTIWEQVSSSFFQQIGSCQTLCVEKISILSLFVTSTFYALLDFIEKIILPEHIDTTVITFHITINT